jgi:hypothetical protein
MQHGRRARRGAVVVVSVVVAGCGGGSAKEEQAPVKAPVVTTAAAPQVAPVKALSRATFIKRADRVCLLSRGVSRRANEVVAKAFGSGSSSKAAQAIENYLPLFADHQRELTS